MKTGAGEVDDPRLIVSNVVKVVVVVEVEGVEVRAQDLLDKVDVDVVDVTTLIIL